MAVDRTPVLKRCRQLGIEPAVMGINKKSNRQPKQRRRQESEYGQQLREKQKAKLSTACSRSSSVDTTTRPRSSRALRATTS
jgi:ribosomal protein S4